MKKMLLIMLFIMPVFMAAFAQQINVSGQVLDEKREPLAGASVNIKNTSTGTMADDNGNFKIAAKQGDVLVFNFLGYNPQTIAVSDNRPLTVILEPVVTEMDEIVVVGYGTQRRSDISTAVASVNMKDITQSGSAQTLQALQGKVSGVQIIPTDGSLSSGMTFRIRGVNSITGGTQPLFVIDGVPMPAQRITNDDTETVNNPLLGLNPNDIASMEILKDAAAAAIYGANGSNGVVIITTKRGAASAKPKFSLSYTGGLDISPKSSIEVLSPEEYATKMLNYATFDGENLINFWQGVIDNKGWNDPSVHKWMDEITQTARKHEVNTSMSGGSNGTNYMVSLGYLNNTGIIKRSAFDRFTSRVNLSQEVSSKINVGVNLSYSTSKDKNPINDWSQTGVMLNALQRSPFLYYPGLSDIMNYSNVNIMSPLVAIEQVDIKNTYNELNGNIYFNYKILDDLTFSTSASYRKYTVGQSKFWGPDTWYGQSEKGRMELTNREEASWVYEARLQYSKNIQKHYFSLMGAFEASKWTMKNIYNKATNFEDTALGIWGIDQGLVTYAPKYTYDGNQTASFISRGTYTFDNRYVLNASLRIDGSSKFGINNKYGYFPAVSVAWRASEEEFIKEIDFISNLRLRTSFGMTGNNQIPSYQSLAQLANNKVVVNGNSVEIGRYPSNVVNDDLKWESQKQYNVGLDFGVLNNRFSFTTDFYYKRIDDMLLQVNIPSTSGYTQAWKNAGSMENKGVDFAINANWLTGDFKWSTDFNISFYKNKILSLDKDQYQQFYDRGLNAKITSDVLLRVGQPVGIYYGYISDGVYNNENEIINGYPGPNLALGQLKVVDTNQDGIIDANDRVPIADVNPLHTGGIGNTFSYKGFDLYVFFRWSYGNDVINGNAYYLVGTASIDNIMKNVYKDVWSASNPTNNYPLYGSGTWGESVMRSDLVEDGSFLRLQTLTLGYNLPTNFVKKMGLSNVRVAATGTNLCLWTRYSGFDPEANTGYGTVARLAPGLDMSPYPKPRSFSFSIELGF
ncbi:TonB-linked SusC/RagA family outer membrane protein [Dysgonomonas hofstadii]|uniref:TonB-linked SusC/RagA family outer membrane protein n=1 Tax=Dysgonomonas hofstadii TaxID=637886 RepID=A0A840CM61_9BACT|nr:TonB-dependent receptor [Dysgonomonas hofstadii]MBB4037137.1 TonB-linked SusC/RagA family outer membrane protein [Dysgonomonas hofstadii]